MKRLQVEWTLRAQAGQRERFTPSRQVREDLEVFSIGRSGPDTHKGKRHHQEPETDPWFHSQFLSRSSQSGSFFPLLSGSSTGFRGLTSFKSVVSSPRAPPPSFPVAEEAEQVHLSPQVYEEEFTH